MSAKYLLRLDDACHNMHRLKWKLIEDLLDEFSIKPIVAVVPDNQDPKLNYDSYDNDFWGKVRQWQAKGWTIAMHGYTHMMHHTESPLLLPYYKRSEFAGLSYEKQAEKIKASWNIFLDQKIDIKVWVAPAHCFDQLTLEAIKNETSIRVVSDGISSGVFYDHDFFWVPQQLWSLEEHSSGLWSVCLHPNMETEESIVALGNNIRNQFNDRIITFQDVELKRQKKSLSGRLYHSYFWIRRRQFRFALQ
jgi:hypothetical protein